MTTIKKRCIIVSNETLFGGGIIVTKDDLRNLFPFTGLCEDEFSEILGSIRFEVKSFSAGEVILDRHNGESALCFVLSGESEVERKRSANEIMPVKTIRKYESFGIISLFSNRKKYPTIVRAKTQSKILFISKDSFDLLLSRFSQVSLNVIRFLCNRIEYLNDSLSTFCAKSAEGRLAKKLLLLREEHGDLIHESMTRLSNEIGIGRASLYRILVEFEKRGMIKTDTKKIIILDPEGLEELK